VREVLSFIDQIKSRTTMFLMARKRQSKQANNIQQKMTPWMSVISYHLLFKLTKISLSTSQYNLWPLLLQKRMMLCLIKKTLSSFQIRKILQFMSQVQLQRYLQVGANMMINRFNLTVQSIETVWLQAKMLVELEAHQIIKLHHLVQIKKINLINQLLWWAVKVEETVQEEMVSSSRVTKKDSNYQINWNKFHWKSTNKLWNLENKTLEVQETVM